jgi:hypothetical protein
MLYPNIPIWVILNIASNLTRKGKSMPNGKPNPILIETLNVRKWGGKKQKNQKKRHGKADQIGSP